jgi:hypothetical protein
VTGDEPAHAHGHDRIQPHRSRYAVAAPAPETNRTIVAIVGASLRPAAVSRGAAGRSGVGVRDEMDPITVRG